MADDLTKAAGVTAPSAPQATAPFLDLGISGVTRYGAISRVYEEFLTSLQGPAGMKLYREQIDNCPITGAFLFAAQHLARHVTFRFEPATGANIDGPLALKIRDRVEAAIFHDLDVTWPDQLSEILSMLGFGWALHELTFKRCRGMSSAVDLVPPPMTSGPTGQGVPPVPFTPSKFNDGWIGFKSWGLRAQETLFMWEWNTESLATAMQQMAPPDYRIRRIPLSKALLFRTTTAKRNPEGRSIIRNAVPSYLYRKNIQQIEAIGIERDFAGYPVFQTVEPDTTKGLMPPDLWNSKDANAVTQLSNLKALVRAIKRDEQEGMVLPWWIKFTLVSTGSRRQFDAQPVDAKVLTPRGWKRMGDLAIGDELVDPKGDVSFVAGVFPKGRRPVFRVTTSDGRSTLADANHLWVVANHRWKHDSKGTREYRVMRTHEIAEMMRDIPDRCHLPPIEPVRYEREGAPELPIDPYVLGVCIGDGHLPFRNNVRFTSADQEIGDLVGAAIASTGDFVSRHNDPHAGRASSYLFHGTSRVDRAPNGRWPNGPIWRGSATKANLGAMGLLGTTSRTKFIPAIYMMGSVEDRLSLLQGLMDTDGTIDSRGFISFGTTSQQLHADVLSVIRSLGGTASSHVRCGDACTVPRDNGPIPHVGGTYYWIKNIRMPEWMNPFRLARKASRVRTFQASYHNAIARIESAGDADVQCILVTAPSHMYITDDFIPTHNTNAIVTRYDQRIAMSVLADFIMLGHQAVGSKALASTKSQLFMMALSSILDNVCAVINRFAIPLLLTLNGVPAEYAPTLTQGDVEEVPIEALGEYIAKLAQAGMPLFPDAELEQALLDAVSLPSATHDPDPASSESVGPAGLPMAKRRLRAV